MPPWPEISSKLRGSRDLTSWKQGQHGNCATIAFAKASNAVWGGRLYSQVEKDGQGGYRIQTHRTYSLSAGQLKAAVQMGDFRGPDNASKAQAIVTVGVLGQCYSETHQVSYQQALDKRANSGAAASEFARCLGIPYWESTAPQKAVSHLSQAGPSQAGVLVALFKDGNNNEGHVEAVIPGSKGTVVGDSYGQPLCNPSRIPRFESEHKTLHPGRPPCWEKAGTNFRPALCEIPCAAWPRNI